MNNNLYASVALDALGYFNEFRILEAVCLHNLLTAVCDVLMEKLTLRFTYMHTVKGWVRNEFIEARLHF